MLGRLTTVSEMANVLMMRSGYSSRTFEMRRRLRARFVSVVIFLSIISFLRAAIRVHVSLGGSYLRDISAIEATISSNYD